MNKFLLLTLIIGSLFIFSVFIASAHQSGCHRWHSCPSDTGSYICGDLGYTSECPSSYPSIYDSYDYTNPTIPQCPSNSYYDGVSSCKCNYGYVVSGSSCVSADSVCYAQLGYNSSNDLLSNSCKCNYGYVISGGQCTYGNTVCHAKYGIYSSYDSSSGSCKCDSGYTFDSQNQCVEKQNNVYFTLKELDTDNKKAIIKSDYDYRYYLITYNTGCYSFSFKRYLNNKIVVNLGIDFDLDTWDKIVLQDDNEVCDITRVERADSNTTLKSEEDETFYFVPQSSIVAPTQTETSKSDPKVLEFLDRRDKLCKERMGQYSKIDFYNTNQCNCDDGKSYHIDQTGVTCQSSSAPVIIPLVPSIENKKSVTEEKSVNIQRPVKVEKKEAQVNVLKSEKLGERLTTTTQTKAETKTSIFKRVTNLFKKLRFW